MKARVVITADGQIALFTDEGGFESGKVQIERLLKALKLDGVQFSEVGQVEQHRHDGQEVQAHTHS